ncbi:MAG: molybdopterin-dependent oxidoreductase [Chloroflexi bacterium]|nr:molybdopterin-dependent oxidoreductase [Chloroflexota bacterium]
MTEKDFLTKALTDTVLTRRSFLKWSATLGGTAVLAGGVNTGLKAVEAAADKAASEGKWVSAACWHNCGGRCLIKAHVVEGVVTRVKTDDTHEDSADYPQQRGCVRGRSQRKVVFGADRLKYPMKRKNWEPGGGKKELRGKDEWVRITWDEAIDIYASEIKRVKEQSGNESIFAVHSGSMGRVLGLYGGNIDRWGSVSWGTWREDYPLLTGIPGTGDTAGNDRFRMRQAKLIVLWGVNSAVSSNGNPTYYYLQAKKAGTKFISIDPIYNDTAVALADEWIPIRPGTDTPMLLAMAYHMIDKNLQDQDFLDKYTVGFDADHMPEGADPNNNFKDYVLGTFDKQPKTPEWASEICGVPADRIRWLAQELATTKPAMIQTAGAPARINNGECLPQAMLTVGWMTGNVGFVGSGVGPNMHSRAANAGAALINAGSNGVKAIPNPLNDKGTRKSAPNILNNCEMWEAILSGKYHAGYDDIRDIDIRMIISADFGDALNQRTNVNKGIQVFRKMEFVAVQSLFLNSSAKYADLVLPVTSQWEQLGNFQTGDREILIYNSQVTKPLFEAKDDLDIAVAVGVRLGLKAEDIKPLSSEQMVYNQLAGCQVKLQDNSGFEPLLTITQQDIAALGAKGEPQTGRIPYQEFKDAGIYRVKRSADDKLGHTELSGYIKDPEGSPLKTKSGKLEIYCESLSELIKASGFNLKDPLPKYDPPIEGYEETFADWEKKIKGDYPLQLYTIHYQRRSHSSFDNVLWLREAFPQETFMNPKDAAERGIKNGNVVLITSKHGKVIRLVLVTNRISPGIVTLGEGAWAQVDEASGIDMAGATNTLNGDFATGQGHSGHNTCIVQVTRYDGPVNLQSDSKWPQRIVFKEA